MTLARRTIDVDRSVTAGVMRPGSIDVPGGADSLCCGCLRLKIVVPVVAFGSSAAHSPATRFLLLGGGTAALCPVAPEASSNSRSALNPDHGSGLSWKPQVNLRQYALSACKA